MSPRSAAANQHIKDLRREDLLRAGLSVFARKGLAAARISDIAAEAHVSQGLVYHYFDTKEALFAEIVELALRETARLAAEALQKSGSAWQRLEYVCERMLSGVRDDPEYVLVILQTFTSEAAPDRARTSLADHGQQTFIDLVRLIRQGQDEGSVMPGDPVGLAIAFTACIQGLALSRLQGNRRAVLPPAEVILRLLRRV